MHTLICRHRLTLTGLAFALLLLVVVDGRAHAQDAQWTGQFWNNRDLSGQPALTRFENSINFNWYGGSPDPRVFDDNFSARWTRRVYFSAGTYRFTATLDDGMRVYIDGNRIIDSWHDSQEHTVTVDVPVAEGLHNIQVDYYEAGNIATAKVSWTAASVAPPSFPNWKAEYFTNPNLAGIPALVRDDAYISRNLGLASPAPGIPADNWSARWTRTLTGQPGQYRVVLVVDDGARVWVNNQLIIDAWRVQGPTRYAVDYFATSGSAAVRVEYFDAGNNASIDLHYAYVGPGAGGGGGGGSGAPGPCSQPVGQNAAVTAETLNVRRGPGTLFEPLTQLSQCVAVAMIGRNNTADWVQITLPNGQTGWVSAAYLQTGVPVGQLPVTYP